MPSLRDRFPFMLLSTPPALPAVLLGLMATVATPAAAGTAAFDFRIAGIRAGEIVLDGGQEAGSYMAEAHIRTAGLVGVIADFFFEGTSTGSITGAGTLVPDTFVARSKSPRAERETRIDWEAGTPVFVSVEPERSSSPDPAAQGGTLDPVSAGYALLSDAPLGEICRKTVDVFDGSRRSRITLGEPQEAKGEIVCDGQYERLEGEEQSFNTSSSYGFRVIFRQDDAGMARLERVETSTQFGPASLVRK